MALLPIYEADNMIIQLELEQRLRESINMRREALSEQHETIKRELNERTGDANDRTVPDRGGVDRGDA